VDRFEYLNKEEFLVHLIDWEIEMTKKKVSNPPRPPTVVTGRGCVKTLVVSAACAVMGFWEAFWPVWGHAIRQLREY
jgi:hypothetical protein